MTGLTPKEGQWIARPKRPRWVAPAVTLIVITSQAPNWFNSIFSSSHSAGIFWAYAGLMLLVALVLSIFALKNHFAARLRPKDSALVDGAFGEQFLVEVTIGSGKERFGTDRGVLWFSDGLMGFSGDATSFVLSADDITLVRPGTKRNNSLPVNAVALNTPQPGFFVIHPLNKAAHGYRERLQLFAIQKTSTDAERIWPPLKPFVETPVLEGGRRSGLE